MELYDTIAGLSLSKKMFISASEKGAANGVATLNANGKVPETQLPSYVDDIVEGYLYEGSFYEDPEHTTEIQGETGKIYVDILTNRSYRWSGSAYVEIGNNDEYTADRALISDANGKITASDITTEELATLDDITGNIQEQINGKISSTEKGAANGLATLDANGKVTDTQLPTVTANKALVSDENGITIASSVTSTELGYVSGVTSAIQTQISGKQDAITGAASSITSSNLTTSRALISDSSGKVAVSSITSTKLGYLSGVTSSIQTQLDSKASTSDLSTLQSYLCRAGLRFKNLGTSFTSAQATAVANGDFSDLWNGDYWEDTLQRITWRIVDNTNFMKNRCTGTSTGKITANHLIVMPDAKLGSGYVANATSSGYGGSTYRNNYRSTYKTKFTNFFGSSHIMTYEDNLTNSATNRTGYSCDIELPQLSNIFGYNPIDEKNYSYLFNAGLSYGQFMLFRLAPQYAQTGDDEWFRDIVTDSNWAIIYSYGLFSSRGPAFTAGFRPFGIII